MHPVPHSLSANCYWTVVLSLLRWTNVPRSLPSSHASVRGRKSMVSPNRWNFGVLDRCVCRSTGYGQKSCSLVFPGSSLCVSHFPGSLSPYECFSSTLKSKYQNKCCNPNASVGGGTTSTPRLPAYSGPIGTNRDCPICGTREYPGRPNQLIVARYVGEHTCGELFGRGFHGVIDGYMCGSLQDFAYQACGCGPYNPACRGDSTKCWGGRNYKAPYIIPFDTSISSGSSVASANDGVRHLRGGAQEEPLETPTTVSTTPIPPEDLHFESKEAEEDETTEVELLEGFHDSELEEVK